MDRKNLKMKENGDSYLVLSKCLGISQTTWNIVKKSRSEPKNDSRLKRTKKTHKKSQRKSAETRK